MQESPRKNKLKFVVKSKSPMWLFPLLILKLRPPPPRPIQWCAQFLSVMLELVQTPPSRPSFPCWEGRDEAVLLNKPIRPRKKVHTSTNKSLFVAPTWLLLALICLCTNTWPQFLHKNSYHHPYQPAPLALLPSSSTLLPVTPLPLSSSSLPVAFFPLSSSSLPVACCTFAIIINVVVRCAVAKIGVLVVMLWWRYQFLRWWCRR